MVSQTTCKHAIGVRQNQGITYMCTGVDFHQYGDEPPIPLFICDFYLLKGRHQRRRRGSQKADGSPAGTVNPWMLRALQKTALFKNRAHGKNSA